MANTTNLDLVKPAGTDKALVSVINANSDKIDAFAGTTNQALSTLNSNLQPTELTVTFDTDKLRDVQAYRYGKIVLCFGYIKAGVLANGYNSFSLAVSGGNYYTYPVFSFVPGGTADDAKNFYGQASNTTVQVRASESNTEDLRFRFIAITV